MRWLSFLLILILSVACTSNNPPQSTQDIFYAPDFTLTAIDGQSYTLSDLRGRWVLLNFWQTTCTPCVAEMPALQQLAETHADKLILLGINIRENTDVIQPFVAELGIRFPILFSEDSVSLDYQVIGLPQTVVISPIGEIVYRQFGPVEMDTFEQQLIELFNAYG